MNKLRSRLAMAAVLVCVASSASVAQAASVVLPFPEAGTVYVSATNGSGVIPAGGQSAFMWTTGDHVVDFFAGAGLGAATAASGSFTISNHLRADLGFDLLINGVDVGSFLAPDTGNCSCNQVFNFNFGPFAPIAGQDYGLEFVLTNTIASGFGSIAFLDGGSITLSGAVPEPATWALMIGGFALAGAALRRRQAPLAA